MPPREKDKPSSRAKDPLWIEWAGSRAQAILLQDLEPDGVLYQQDHLSSDDLFTFYKKLPAFEKVVFSQFHDRLKSHRKKNAVMGELAKRDEEAMKKDRAVVGRSIYNQRYELVFDMTKAKDLLRSDVEKGLHEQMTPTALQESRPEYQLFGKSIFKHRIYAEVRRQKFVYFLATKRAKDRPCPPRNREQFREQFGSQFASEHQGGGP
jgi:hypothetical protein